MKYLLIILSLIFFTSNINAQEDYIATWKKKILELENSDFKKVNMNEMKHLDLSGVISNESLEKHSVFSSYTGAFGPKYRRIDFRLTAQKSHSFVHTYDITGKSRLDNNIRALKGTMKLTTLFCLDKKYVGTEVYIGLFNYQFNEPGDKDGDGLFEGIATLVFHIENGKCLIYWSECGDFSSYDSTFVGKWRKYNAKNTRKCIFSLSPDGFRPLPFCDDLYIPDEENEDMTYINPEYSKYGWEGFDKFEKTKWW